MQASQRSCLHDPAPACPGKATLVYGERPSGGGTENLGETFAWRRLPPGREGLGLSHPTAGRLASTPVRNGETRLRAVLTPGVLRRKEMAAGNVAVLCSCPKDQYRGGCLVKRTEALLGSNLGRNSQADGASMDGTQPR